MAAQIGGAVLGVWAAHLMFDIAVFQASANERTGPAQWFFEAVATFGLVLVIFLGLKARPAAIPALVGFFITAAYWFTASTSFANPAVTIARAMTDTFSGILPSNAPGFILAQFAGAAAAVVVAQWFDADDEKH